MRTAFLLALLLILACSAGFASELALLASCDWFLGTRLGLEYAVVSRLGLRVDAGASLHGAFLADLCGVLYLLPAKSRFRLQLLLGIPNLIVPFDFSAAALIAGASVLIGYRVNPWMGIDLRLGAGYPIFLEDGVRFGATRFWLDLWPDASIGLSVFL